VDYSHVGLGFAGRGSASTGGDLVPEVTVSIRNMSHGFFALDAFIPAVPTILPMNGFSSTMTAEDLDTQG
jgi:hypothetical protein